MRLTMAIGCALACVMGGCKEAQTEQAVAEYAMLTVLTGIIAVVAMILPQTETLYDMICSIFDL